MSKNIPAFLKQITAMTDKFMEQLEENEKLDTGLLRLIGDRFHKLADSIDETNTPEGKLPPLELPADILTLMKLMGKFSEDKS